MGSLGLGAGLALLVIAMALALAWLAREAIRSQRVARLAIADEAGVQWADFVSLGGRPQWVSVRGRDRHNPILLVVHGGPGVALSPFPERFRLLEARFTVVQWDQPGAGRTLGAAGLRMPEGLNQGQIVDDGIRLAEILGRRFPGRRIVLAGVSAGAVFAVEMVRRRPDFFATYVGIAQPVDVPAQEQEGYSRVLRRAMHLRDESSVRALEAIGPPPYASLGDLLKERRIAERLAPDRAGSAGLWLDVATAPDYDLRDVVAYAMAPGWNWNAEQFLGRDLQGPWMRTVLKPLSSGPPVVLIQGAQDDITPTSLASAWLRRAAVAEKLVCIVSGAGHNAILSAPADIDAVMTHVVSPLAQGIRPHPEALSTCVPP